MEKIERGANGTNKIAVYRENGHLRFYRLQHFICCLQFLLLEDSVQIKINGDTRFFVDNLLRQNDDSRTYITITEN